MICNIQSKALLYSEICFDSCSSDNKDLYLLSLTNFNVGKLHYTEIKKIDRMLQVTWLFVSNQIALYQNLLTNSGPIYERRKSTAAWNVKGRYLHCTIPPWKVRGPRQRGQMEGLRRLPAFDDPPLPMFWSIVKNFLDELRWSFL